jgi:hypothetical protein
MPKTAMARGADFALRWRQRLAAMPKKAALKFRDVQEAVDWATKAPPEQASVHQGFQGALMNFIFSRPNYGLRAAYTEGARLFEKAAAKANELAFELEAQYQKIRDSSLRIDEEWLDTLAKQLLVLAQACHRWVPDASAGLYLENYLAALSPLDADGQSVRSEEQELKGMVTAHKRRGISRADLLQVPLGKDARVPMWWTAQPQPMRTAALNLRRVSFKLQVFAHQARRSGGGRPKDGDRIQLIRSARALGISISALSFLMAAFAVKPSWPTSAAMPESVRAMRHGGRPPGVLSAVERTWLEASQQKWFNCLTEAPKDLRKKRKKDEANLQRLVSEPQCPEDQP